MHSIELKFGMYITGHRWTNPIGFVEFRINVFFTIVKKRILMHCRPVESNYKKYASA